MADTDRITRLTAIRDNLEKELQDETARRAALTAAGHPPPTTYSVAGRSVDWNGYLRAMLDQIRAIDEVLTGEDEPYELPLRGYS